MVRSRKSQTKVGLNTKLSAVDLMTIAYDGQEAFIEGAPVARGADGSAVKPDGTVANQIVYINFVDSQRNDVIDVQGDPFGDLPAAKLSGSGKLTGIVGRGMDIGLPKECWEGGALPAIGDGVLINASGLFEGTAGAPTAGVAYYGIVERYQENKAYFHFTSRPVAAG